MLLSFYPFQLLPYKDLSFDVTTTLKEIIETDDYAEARYFVDVDQKHPDEINGNTRNFPFCP